MFYFKKGLKKGREGHGHPRTPFSHVLGYYSGVITSFFLGSSSSPIFCKYPGSIPLPNHTKVLVGEKALYLNNRMPVHLKVTPQHFMRLPWQFSSTYSWVDKGTAKVSVFPKNTTKWHHQVSNQDLLTLSPVHRATASPTSQIMAAYKT